MDMLMAQQQNRRILGKMNKMQREILILGIFKEILAIQEASVISIVETGGKFVIQSKKMIFLVQILVL